MRCAKLRTARYENAASIMRNPLGFCVGFSKSRGSSYMTVQPLLFLTEIRN